MLMGCYDNTQSSTSAIKTCPHCWLNSRWMLPFSPRLTLTNKSALLLHFLGHVGCECSESHYYPCEKFHEISVIMAKGAYFYPSKVKIVFFWTSDVLHFICDCLKSGCVKVILTGSAYVLSNVCDGTEALRCLKLPSIFLFFFGPWGQAVHKVWDENQFSPTGFHNLKISIYQRLDKNWVWIFSSQGDITLYLCTPPNFIALVLNQSQNKYKLFETFLNHSQRPLQCSL